MNDVEAPPAYADVVRNSRYPILRVGSRSEEGAQGNRLNHLQYVDFTPNLHSVTHRGEENFLSLVKRANDWLKDHDEYRVLNCETITWAANQRFALSETERMESVIRTKSSGIHHMRSLRLWLIERRDSGQTETVLGIRDYEPNYSIPDHCELPMFLKLVNNRIQEDPIPGNIICIETLMKMVNPHVSSKETKWLDSGKNQRTYGFFIRIFYSRGPACRDIIGFKDFPPGKVRKPGAEEELYDKAVRSANQWISLQHHIRVRNLQSIVYKRKDSVKKITERLLFSVNFSKSSMFYQVLRVAYTKTVNAPNILHSPMLCLAKKTFAPQRREVEYSASRKRSFESLTTTVQQVSDWLDFTGAPLFCVETVPFRVKFGKTHDIGPEATVMWNALPGCGTGVQHWLTHVRIYVRSYPVRVTNQGFRLPLSRGIMVPRQACYAPSSVVARRKVCTKARTCKVAVITLVVLLIYSTTIVLTYLYVDGRLTL